MIELSNGHRFEFQCGSGALAFDGRGWWWEHPLRWFGMIDPSKFTVVAKTVTSSPRLGRLSMWHPWTCVRLLKYGTVNAVGLTNPGVERWVKEFYPRTVKDGIKVAASVESDGWEDAFFLGAFLKPLDLAFVEVNVSCPNIQATHQANHVYKVVKGLRAACSHPIIVKLSNGQTTNTELLHRLNGMPEVEAIHAINTVPWDQVFPGKVSPIEKDTGVKGGVSGRYIHDIARQSILNVRKHAPDKPVVAGGGIESVNQVANFHEDGAAAFSIGTLFLRRPWRPKQIIAEWGNSAI